MSNDEGWTIIDITDMVGDDVICDFCNASHGELVGGGGMLGNSHGFCPDCTESLVESAEKHGETDHITLTPPGVSHNRFIRDVRSSGNAITAARIINEMVSGDASGIRFWKDNGVPEVQIHDEIEEDDDGSR